MCKNEVYSIIKLPQNGRGKVSVKMYSKSEMTSLELVKAFFQEITKNEISTFLRDKDLIIALNFQEMFKPKFMHLKI